MRVSIRKEGARIRVTIADNGRGIDAETLREIEAGAFSGAGGKGHIGMSNAIARIRMYYGTEAAIEVESAPGEGTRIRIEYPAS